MKRLVCSALLALLCGAGAVFAEGADEKAIQARSDEFVAGWNHHDAKAMAAIWAPDGDLINPFGRVAKGRKAVEQLFVDEHGGMMKTTTFAIDAHQWRMLDATTALLDWDVTVSGVMAPAGAPTSLKNHLNIVMVKKNGSWWIAAARPVVYAPDPGAAHH
jgi:uncharacterized protein (TIGR02246 family)